jgi:hypothetical protein
LTTWLSEDFERVLQADVRLMVDGARKVKEQRRRRAVQFIIGRINHHLNEGVRDKDEMLRLVQAETEKRFRSLILLWILGGIVQYLVLRILKKIFPVASE